MDKLSSVNNHNSFIKPPTIKSSINKTIASKILYEASIRNEEVLKFFFHNIFVCEERSNDNSEVINSSENIYDSMVKNETGFVGLKNQFCICYMNSTLQQLYMTQKFKETILSIYLNNLNVKDEHLEFLREFQKLFGYLQESNKLDYDIKNFIKTMKDATGEEINIRVQQDAGEFIGNLFQHLENALCGTKYQNLVKDCFGFELANELTVKPESMPQKISEPFSSFRSEDSSYLSVEVQGYSCLKDSLLNFIKEDQVDYTWEYQNKKYPLPTFKRSLIKSLPNNLIIHLKRFTYDFERNQSVKINSRFEFPIELNIEEYCVKSDFEKEYVYELNGITVHTGCAQGGHYFSYIRNNDQWYEFNDSKVGHFDGSELFRKSYGGKSEVEEETFHYSRNKENNQNAFILFYRRKVSKAVLNFTPTLSPIFHGNFLAQRRLKAEKNYEIQNNMKVKMPEYLLNEIMEDNRILSRTNHLNTDLCKYLSKEEMPNLVEKISTNILKPEDGSIKTFISQIKYIIFEQKMDISISFDILRTDILDVLQKELQEVNLRLSHLVI